MSSLSSSLSDEEFFYSFLTEYLDGELNSEDSKRFDDIISKNSWDHLKSEFGISRGQLQIGMQKIYVDDQLNHKLHVLVEDDAARANHEAEDIDTFSKSEGLGKFLRAAVLASVIGGVCGFIYKQFGPESQPAFSALDSLVYESLVLIEDPDGRIDFPTSNLDELANYFSKYPDLGFLPKKIASPGNQWVPQGGSVIDYEVQKILMAQFGNPKSLDKMFIYLFEGSLKDLPSSDKGNHKGLLYQTYSSEFFNVVAWQLDDDVLGMIVGSRSGADLAAAAYNSLGQ